MRRGPPNMASTVRRFSYPVTLRRYSAPTVNADGLPVSATSTDTRVLAHCYPVDGKTIERLPAGHELAGGIMGSIGAELRLGDRATGRRADVVIFNGEQYEVAALMGYTSGPNGRTRWREFAAKRVDR